MLLKSFNSISSGCPFPPQALQATITVLPKLGKDCSYCNKFRPISLFNIDTKLYAKLIALRLRPYIPKLVQPEQVGFVMGREARDNTIKSLSLMAKARQDGSPLCLVSIDAEKAFDRVHWGFLEKTLIKIGLGRHILERIMVLYKNPTARVRVNGTLSGPLPIKNGMRQGCPLSPLLYVLVMESLANALRSNPNIRGINIGQREHKLALFADDILMYLMNLRVGIPVLLKEFRRYSKISNFRVNVQKSEILNVNLTDTEVAHLSATFPLKWKMKEI
ncbi:Reverse transcriptase (RNA-dependent DNA polymerase) [Pristimantis euphronides]